MRMLVSITSIMSETSQSLWSTIFTSKKNLARHELVWGGAQTLMRLEGTRRNIQVDLHAAA